MTFLDSEKTKIGWVLRDQMQSTGIWTFDENVVSQLAVHANKTGFSHLELGGGQSFQIALQQSTNPYRLLRSVKCKLDELSEPMPLQILLRGANQFGFRHFSHQVQRKNLDLLVNAAGDTDKCRALIIRSFDALNDVENLRFSIEYLVKKNIEAEKQGGKLAHIQVALSYVAPRSADDNVLYSTEYYLAYAKSLRAIAQNAGGDLDSICIKDMSGQLNAESARALVSVLQSLGLPLVLHCHSTDEAKSLAAVLAAAESGVTAVEVAIKPLSGGASHHDVNHVLSFPSVASLDITALRDLETLCIGEFSFGVALRRDFKLPVGSLKLLADQGVPGGAIPFVISDLREHACKMLGIELEEAIDAFSEELDRLQKLLGYMPLVTPTADIIAKQTIKNLGNRVRSQKYQLIDPRFCGLVLGHYGDVINHATGEKQCIDQSLVDEIIEHISAIEPDLSGDRVSSGKVYPPPVVRDTHPASDVDDSELDLAEEYIHELAARYPASVERFGSFDQCAMMQVMRPAGDTQRLLTCNVLGPTEKRLRLLLDRILMFLPDKNVPEARVQKEGEQTDFQLLELLGDYEGIVESIKDLVMSVNEEDLQSRVEELEQRIVGEFCKRNPEGATHKLYIERRFVALFAAAVFWDLQRICRRTGSDSRSDVGEMTAYRLGKIISTTLSKRRAEGRGAAGSYLA